MEKDLTEDKNALRTNAYVLSLENLGSYTHTKMRVHSLNAYGSETSWTY